MGEQRGEARKKSSVPGYFHADGRLVEIKLRDAASSGLGLFASHQFNQGQQGVVLLKSPGTGSVNEIPGEVRWCKLDPGSEDRRFPYRVGLRLLV
jgi:hypothetical protein